MMEYEEQKTFKVKISRDWVYEYEIKADDDTSAIHKGYEAFYDGETEGVKLINEECIDANVMNCEEKTNG